jgi:hypothetical protein
MSPGRAVRYLLSPLSARTPLITLTGKAKDPGIPALFPYKEQVLEEMKQAKIQANRAHFGAPIRLSRTL